MCIIIPKKKIYKNSKPEILNEKVNNGYYEHIIVEFDSGNDLPIYCRYLEELVNDLNKQNDLPGKLYYVKFSNKCGADYKWDKRSLKEQSLS